MVTIDGKEYVQKVPMNRENGEYNSALLYYINTQREIKELQNQLKKYAETVKRLAKED